MARPRLLDLTRLMSRAGTMPTGVDRVEAAYLRYFLNTSDIAPCYGLVRTALGFVLLDKSGLKAVQAALVKAHWPFPDPVSLLNRRLTPAMRRGQTLARRRRFARATRPQLTAMLERRLPDGFDYYNVGHSGLAEKAIHSIAAVPGARINVLIHDTIPLDHPGWQREGTVEQFRQKFATAARHAHRIITTATATRDDILRHLAEVEGDPQTVVAPLGVRAVTPNPHELPADLPPKRPYFVTVGTIEPRKNHALLLDLWDALDEDGPSLLICGARGWNNADVFARLDKAPLNVHELPGLSDGGIAALLKGSCGLLFPSRVEGYGLPPIEAAMLGVPVVAADLPIYHEVLGQSGVYLDPDDLYSWKKEVERLTKRGPSRAKSGYTPPSWAEHFKIVFTGR